MFVCTNTTINSGATPIHYFTFMGVQTQLLEIRISLGGSALLVFYHAAPFEPRATTKLTIMNRHFYRFYPFAAALAAFLMLAPLALRAQFSYNGRNFATLESVFTLIGTSSGTKVITVTDDNGTFGGACTVRSGQTIVIKSSGPQRTIKRRDKNGVITINENGTLTMASIIVDCNNVYDPTHGAPILNYSTNTLTLDNCIIKNSYWSHMGALHSCVDLTVAGNVRFEDNYGIADGGAVFVGLTCEYWRVRNATFLGNVTCVNCSGNTDEHWHWEGKGGAIFCGGNLLIHGNATFENCRLSTRLYYEGNHGGAIFAGGNVEIRGNASFVDCFTHTGRGGAICAEGAITLSGSNNVFKRNKVEAWTDLNGYAKGGAIYCGKGGTISNAVIGGSEDDANVAQDGGGIYSVCGPLILNNCTISYNKAKGGKGDNDGAGWWAHSGSNGGGVFIETGDLTLNNTTIAYNKAIGDSDADYEGYGGGVYMVSQISEDGTANELSFENGSVIDHNEATHGGGVYVVSSHRLELTNANIHDNTATANGGGIYYKEEHGPDASPPINKWIKFNWSVRRHNFNNNSQTDITANYTPIGLYKADGTLITTSANTTPYQIIATLPPGEYYFKSLNDFVLEQGVLYNFVVSFCDENGRPVYTSSYDYSDSHSVVFNGYGHATDPLGNIYYQNLHVYNFHSPPGNGVYQWRTERNDATSSTITTEGTPPVNNIFCWLKVYGEPTSGLRIMDDGVVVSNTAANGGGIYIAEGDVEIYNSSCSYNAASNDGGGIYNNGGTLRATGTTINGNTATHKGAGIYTRSGN